MKYLVALLAAGTVVHAATPVNRQASPSAAVRSAVQAIIDDASALQTAIESFTGTAQLGTVEDTITKLQGDISSGSATFSSLSPVSSDDALNLSSLITPLTTGTDNAVSAVIAKHDTIVNACAGQIAYQTFQSLIPAAQTFATNLANLVPTLYQPVVQKAGSDVQASLQRGLSAFNDAQTLPASCTGGGSSSSTSSGTSSLPGSSTTAPPAGSSTTAPIGTYTTGSSTSVPVPSGGTTTLPGSSYSPTASSNSPVATYNGDAASGAMVNFGVVALAIAAAAL